MTIIEGEPYKFGRINFVGNIVHTNEKLNQQLGIKEGDIFVALNVLTKKRRIIQIDKALIENISKNRSRVGRRILKG